MADKRSALTFRPEVLQAKAALAHGPVMLAQPASSWWLAIGSLAITAGVITYLVLGTYTPRATVTGSLVPQAGAIKVLSPAPGVIAESRVREGQQVSKGDVLFVLADER